MTPFEIDILLWYVAHAEDHPVVSDNPPIWAGTRERFLRDELLAPEVPDRLPRMYQLGDCGRAYMEHILALPLPIKTWTMP